MKKILFNALIWVVISVNHVLVAQINSSESLLKSMYNRYHNNFNSDITFLQMNEEYDETGKVKHRSISYEAFHYPGKFRTDNGPIPHKDGFILSNDTLYLFKDTKFVSSRPCIMDIGLLTGDMYFMPFEKAYQECKLHGYNMTKFRKDSWKGKDVYVVGADKGDERSPQFWIDADELYVVRDINFNEADNQLEDVHYLEHTLVDKAWVEERVEIYRNGKLYKKEHYTEVKANNALNQDIFNPAKVGSVFWRK